jgi:hypothetical protein
MMRAMAKRRVALGLLASATISGLLAVGGPAYGQFGQSSGVTNTGDAFASTGGNQSSGNSSSNVAGNTSNQTNTSTEPLLGSVLGLVLNLSGTGGNASNGTSSIQTGSAQAAGNNSDTAVGQQKAGGGGGVVGTVFNPFVAPVPAQSAGVTNSGSGSASTGGNSGVGNNSSNVASNTNTVNAGLIAIGLSLGQNATNTSDGTSAINTGPAQAAGNQSTTAVDQTSVGGGRGFGPGVFGIGGGVACEGFFTFFGPGGGQRANVDNAGVAEATTGDNAGVGNQSQNTARNENTVNGGLITLDLGGLLSNSASNVSDGTSGINTGGAQAAGNQATTAINQECIQPVRGGPGFGGPGGPGGHHGIGGHHFVSPPVITPGFRHLGDDVRIVPIAVQGGQLARTGRDPFVMGLVAFSLLFGGLMFLVWEKVEAYPKRSKLAA